MHQTLITTRKVRAGTPFHARGFLGTSFPGAVTGKLMDPLLGVGVFNSDGAMWKWVLESKSIQVSDVLGFINHTGFIVE